MDQRRLKIASALTRPQLFAGGEFTPVALTGGTGIMFLACAWNFWSVVALLLGLLFLGPGLYLLRRIARRDPQMFAVFIRYSKYGQFRRAYSTPFCRERVRY
jgi:type IV secretory pathway TrbD component